MDFSTLLILDCKTAVWENSAAQPTGQTNEIICIDLALIDTVKNEIKEQEKILVQPTKAKISPYCYKLYGISQSEIDSKGISFQEAYRKLRIYYMSRDRFWGSWGGYEKYILEKQYKLSGGLETLFTCPHFNIQHYFTLMTGNKEEPFLTDALEQVGLEPSDNNAVDTANIYMRMAKGLRPATSKTRIIVSRDNQYSQN